MISNKSAVLFPPRISCLNIILTRIQYETVNKILKKESFCSIFEKYLFMEADILSCIINNIKKDKDLKGRSFKYLNIRCNNKVMEKLISYENLLGANKEEIIKCFLLTIANLV